MSTKIIVLGDPHGEIQSSLAQLTKLHTKNNFAFALVTGNLFSEDNDEVSQLLDGRLTVPLPTYFTIGTNPLPARVIAKIEAEEEICPNLHYLGKRSTTKTSEGIKIVALGGQLAESIIGGTSKEQHLPFHTIGDAKALYGANQADILLTSVWPDAIRAGSKVPVPEGFTDIVGQGQIADLCAVLRPRYHFASSPDFFFEREPFFHPPTGPKEDSPDVSSVTRFISLAARGNATKQKSVYAFTLQASVDPSVPIPPGSTRSPFLSRPNPKKRRALDPEPYSRYGNGHDRRSRGPKRSRGPPPGPDQCFFCLSNPNVSEHLVSSIGDHSYLTIAKGPLTTSETNAALGIDFPAHALIIPLTHSPTLAVMQEDAEAAFTEMTKFKDSLQSMIAKLSSNKLGAVTYEISKGNGVHVHWQLIPIDQEIIRKGLVEAAFRVEAENSSYPAFEVRDPGVGQNDGDFFRVWIWTPPSDEEPLGSTKCLTMPFDYTNKFSIQFGRTVLAKLLGLQKRGDWRECAQTVDEEKKDMEAFKVGFGEFDFTA
ncbi:hypothetical protein HYFRA_00011162 [Hymenoscyphus fraxineus]|uniref:CwfJ domain protein n=1 Tax=Hymenoscyphus fraxineus TaxID=746836 RepID=A0A9N9L233_9HELO|nr:hypothetical protein HYFRA_00011162 [Hymenoscyphus fraxineus]